MTPPLRVAVPAAMTRLSPMTGTGRVWTHTLPLLRREVGVDAVELRPYPQVTPSDLVADAWLCSGHDAGVDVAMPVVAVVHEVGWITPELRSYIDPVFCGIIAAQTAATIMRATRVLTPSAWSQRQVLATFAISPDRVHVVPYGVDPGVFRPSAQGGRAWVAAAAGVGRPYVLFAGSVQTRKNIAAVRAAVARLVAEGLPHILLLVAGDAPDRPISSDLRRLAEAELPGAPGRILAARGVSDADLAALMAEADAVCLPSLSEGFGLTALEAMACGAPLVVSRRGSLPEVVGDAAVVVEPTADGVHDGLQRILTDATLAAELRRRGRARAEMFPWERTAEGWLTVLRLAVGD